jgi:uncharacterized protein YuzE
MSKALHDTPTIEYTAESDILYIRFRAEEHSAQTHVVDDQRIVDFAADGSLYGVEFIGASAELDLSDLPERDRIEAAIMAIPQFRLTAAQ